MCRLAGARQSRRCSAITRVGNTASGPTRSSTTTCALGIHGSLSSIRRNEPLHYAHRRFRYVLMYDIGGLYCDLDYEFVRPYDYGDASIVFSLEFEVTFGDPHDQVANFFFRLGPATSIVARRARRLAAAPAACSRVDRRLGRDRAVVFERNIFPEPEPLRGHTAHVEAGVQPEPRSWLARARVIREQRDHVRVPPRLGLVEGRVPTFADPREKVFRLIRPEAAAAAAARRHPTLQAPGAARRPLR